MRCVSCGLTISDKYHITESGNVCERCWTDPNLFFPEKLKDYGTLEYVRNLLGSDIKSDEILELPVIKLKQKDYFSIKHIWLI